MRGKPCQSGDSGRPTAALTAAAGTAGGTAAHRAVRTKPNQNKGAKSKHAHRPPLLHFRRCPASGRIADDKNHRMGTTWGNVAVADGSPVSAVQVRFKNDGGKAFARAELHLAYRVPTADPTAVTFAGKADDKPRTVATGNNVRTKWVEIKPAK